LILANASKGSAVEEENRTPVSRRDLIALIGTVGGAATMYQAMTALGHAAESSYRGPVKLDGDVKGTSVLVLGAGLAGLVAAYELKKAGYKVQVLEYNDRVGGRCWSLRGGDSYTELGGFTQRVEFDKGLYFNGGPWRIPFHHRGLLDYCKRFGVALEPFVHVNNNAYLHATDALGGKPQRYRHVEADFQGYVGELLAKAINKSALDQEVTREDKEKLLEALRAWGALDRNYAYARGRLSSDRRGYDKEPAGGLSGEPVVSQPIGLSDLLKMQLWSQFGSRHEYEYQAPMFQPVGGMDMIARAFQREAGSLVRFSSKVTAIKQDGNGVTVAFEDTKRQGRKETARADWCLCTIPLTVLSQMEIDVGNPMRTAISAIPYASSMKVGLQFKRRFWEEDEAIYGGITFTDLPVRQISYPSSGYHTQKGILLGAYPGGTYAVEFTALAPEERVKRALAYCSQIHPQCPAEFETGASVAWLRVPSAFGCFAQWSDDARAQHYENLCAIDGRILLAGEHASYVSAWQEGAVLSALDAISRLHKRVVAG
jgi:monoamine oxidase